MYDNQDTFSFSISTFANVSVAKFLHVGKTSRKQVTSQLRFLSLEPDQRTFSSLKLEFILLNIYTHLGIHKQIFSFFACGYKVF